MKKCECGCGLAVWISTKKTVENRKRDTSARFLPGHNTRKKGGYGRAVSWNG